MDNLPDLLDVINIAAIQTPFLSTGILSRQELNVLFANSVNARKETLQFIKLVLHKGDEAIRILLLALKISLGDTIIEKLLKTVNIEDELKGKLFNIKTFYINDVHCAAFSYEIMIF